MAYQIIVQPRAEADIADAYAYLREHAPHAAARWYHGLKAALESLSEMPARCPVAPESAKLQFELRQLLYGQRSGLYRVVFRILDPTQEVHVLAVRHGARKPILPADLEL